MEPLSRRERRLAHFYTTFCMLGLMLPGVPALVIAQEHLVAGLLLWVLGAMLLMALPLALCKQFSR